MSENGVLMYDLAGNWCEECGRAKSLRMFGYLTGCTACDVVVTAHRCTGRPDLGTGESWECPDCGTVWTAGEKEETCGECGQGIGTMRRTWENVPGDRLDTAPRHDLQPFTPFRNALHRTAGAALSRPLVSPANNRYPGGPIGSCYRLASGAMVHVKPGCRC